jgi:hypothetical protein
MNGLTDHILGNAKVFACLSNAKQTHLITPVRLYYTRKSVDRTLSLWYANITNKPYGRRWSSKQKPHRPPPSLAVRPDRLSGKEDRRCGQ